MKDGGLVRECQAQALGAQRAIPLPLAGGGAMVTDEECVVRAAPTRPLDPTAA
jgi:hypothetical protein